MKIVLNGHGLPTRVRRLKRRRLLPNRRRSAQHVGHRDGKGTSAPLRPTRNVANMNTFMSSVAAIVLIGAIDVALIIDLLDVPALAALSGTESAQETMTALQASGYKVIVNKAGEVPLAQCTVIAARPGRQITQLVGSGDDKVTKVLYTTVYVDVSADYLNEDEGPGPQALVAVLPHSAPHAVDLNNNSLFKLHTDDGGAAV
jgi:hypothetical protein